MVAQLIRQDDGSYDYVEVDTAKKTVAPDLTEFEAYEGVKKGGEDLVSTPSITEQTEKLRREIPSQVEFDAKTGTFITKKAKTIDLEYKAPEITPESAEDTALQKVMKMSEQMRPEPVDYSAIMKESMKAAYEAQKPTWKDYALQGVSKYLTNKMTGAGGDIIIHGMTQHVLGKTMAGRLATGGMMAHPYAAVGSMLLQETGAGKKVAKTVTKAAKSVVDFFTGGTVICTELYKQKLMSKEDCRLSWNFTVNNFSSTHLNGYWYWAVPMTKIMKKNKLVTKLWNHIMSNRTKDIKWRLNKGKFNLLGRLYSILIENGSYIIGKLIKNKKTKEVLV